MIDDAARAAFDAAGYVLTASRPVPVTGYGSRSKRKGFVSVTLRAQPKTLNHPCDGFTACAESALPMLDGAVRATVSALAAKVRQAHAQRADAARVAASVALARATTEHDTYDAVYAALGPLTRAP